MRSLGELSDRVFGNLSVDWGWIDPVVASLDASPVCNANAACITARGEFYRLQTARDDGTLDKLVGLSKELKNSGALDKLSTDGDEPQPAVAVGDQLAGQAGSDRPAAGQAAARHGAEAGQRSGGRQSSDRRRGGASRRPDQADGPRPRPGVVVPDGDGAERLPTLDGGVQRAAAGTRHRRVQEDRADLRLTRRACGPVLHPDRPEPVQHRGDGSGEDDPRHREGRATEHHARECVDFHVGISGDVAGHQGLLRRATSASS